MGIEYTQKTTTYMTYRRVCNKSNMAGATCGAGAAYLSEAPVNCISIIVLYGRLVNMFTLSYLVRKCPGTIHFLPKT